MNPLQMDWIDVVSNFSEDSDQITTRSSGSITSGVSAMSAVTAVSKRAFDAHGKPEDRCLFKFADVKSPTERARKKMQPYLASSLLFGGRSLSVTPHCSPRFNRSTPSVSEVESSFRRNAPRPTTYYREYSRSFCTWEVSQYLRAPQVIETPQVVVRKDEQCKTINDYLVLEDLGAGSYGKVSLVESITTGEKLAMKAIQAPGTKANDKRRTAIQREIAVMKRICHPNLVQLREVLGNLKSGKLYLVLQYVSGGSIAKKLTRNAIHPIPEDVLRHQARQLVSALKYLQVNGVVHRDIKPDNILVDEHGQVYLSDFGVSAVCTDEVVSGVEGTPAFMAPEVCRGDAEVTGHLVDVWALGASLFQLMYGVLPFIASNVMDLSRSILADRLVFPDEDDSRWLPFMDEFGVPDVKSSQAFKDLMRGMLQKDPAERWGVRKILNSQWLAGLDKHPVGESALRQLETASFRMDFSYDELSNIVIPAEIMYI